MKPRSGTNVLPHVSEIFANTNSKKAFSIALIAHHIRPSGMRVTRT